MVRAHRGLMPDEVPAILQTGEAVLSRRAVNAMGSNRVSDMNAGRTGGGSVIDLGGVRSDLQGLRRDLISLLPTMLEKAARHGVQTGGRR